MRIEQQKPPVWRTKRGRAAQTGPGHRTAFAATVFVAGRSVAAATHGSRSPRPVGCSRSSPTCAFTRGMDALLSRNGASTAGIACEMRDLRCYNSVHVHARMLILRSTAADQHYCALRVNTRSGLRCAAHALRALWSIRRCCECGPSRTSCSHALAVERRRNILHKVGWQHAVGVQEEQQLAARAPRARIHLDAATPRR